MAFTPSDFDDRLVASVDQSSQDLRRLLEGLTRALMGQARLTALDLALDGLWVLHLRRDRSGVTSHWQGNASIDTGAAARSRVGTVVLPIDIVFAGRAIGVMHAQLESPRDLDGPLPGLLAQFAQQCGRLSMRYGLERWSRDRWGQPLRLVGLSRALRDLDRFIEIASGSALPAVLYGEFGTEKLQLATAIHCCGARAERPFVTVRCAGATGEPFDWLADAGDGTLFLADIDMLPVAQQVALSCLLPTRRMQWGASTARIIVSATADLRSGVSEGRFLRALATELDFLAVTIPPIRDRVDDVDALVCDVIARLGQAVDTKRTDALIQACRGYAWPENQSEVERVVARLATMTGSSPILDADILRHAPHIVAPETAVDDASAAATSGATEWASLDHWARLAIGAASGDWQGVHVALQRALTHLGRHYEQPLPLAELATIAGVSASQLTALFRTVVGAPFKTLLRHIRVHKARELLAADPTASVTEIAYRIGFADLSYFERSFRRIVGTSPREFRRDLARLAAPRSALAAAFGGSAQGID